MTSCLIRIYQPTDAKALAVLINTCHQADQVGTRTTAQGVRVLGAENLGSTLHDYVVEAGSRIVGLGMLEREEGTRLYARLWVHPSMRNNMIGMRLISHVEALARQFPEPCLDIAIRPTETSTQEWAEELGYRYVRSWWRMHVDLLDLPAPSELPAGYRLRAFVPGQDERALTTVEDGVFHDHWGEGAHTLEGLQHEFNRPWFDPALLNFLQLAGQPVGYVWSWIDPERIAATGQAWGEISNLGLVPEYRGRGLGRVLLLRALADLKARGMQAVELDMDGPNIRARRLYESVGFYGKEETRWYRKHLREGGT
jgi:mycothiol synthase